MLIALVALIASTTALAAQPPSIVAKQAEARQVVAEINGLNASLGRSDELVNFANLKLAQVQSDISVNRRELAIARRNLLQSQRTIARRLVTLYTKGSTSTLEVILGAQSLEDVIKRVDAANQVSSVDRQVAVQVTLFKSSVEQHRRRLVVEQRNVRHLVALRSRQKQAIETQLGERQRLLGSLDGEVQRLIAAQQARALAAGRLARQRAADAQSRQIHILSDTAVGASAQTPEGAAVLPPASYSGVVGVALQELGVPYQWAGDTPNGFDCSGLVMYAYSQVGVSLPHSSYSMWTDGVAVPRDQLEPGDLVFFDGLGHVGIYIGAGEFVHAPHTGTVVQVSSLDTGSYAGSYIGARRIL